MVCAPLGARCSPLIEIQRVRIPRADGAPPYEGLVALAREDGLEGAGEAALIEGRSGAAEACAVEIARLDLEARRAGVRVADLLGGARRGQVDCTALITSRQPEAVARSVDAKAAAGFAAFKLKAADGGRELDAARLGAARRAAGEGARIRLDLGGALTVERALAVLPGLARQGLEMIEQPVGTAEPAAAWSRLLSAGLPVFADESLGDPQAACAILEVGAGAALKLATVGGPRAALRLAAAATAATVGSGFESSLGLAAALHVACALAGAPLACGLATAPLLAGDLAEGLPSGPVLRLPAGPGLGVQLDHGALARYRVDR